MGHLHTFSHRYVRGLFWSAFTLAFYGFLRASQLTSDSLQHTTGKLHYHSSIYLDSPRLIHLGTDAPLHCKKLLHTYVQL